ncbi:MAG: hypothetical protein ACYTEU_11595 [Planctomycetota bacterium]
MGVLSITFLLIAILTIIVMVVYLIFAPNPLKIKEEDVLKTEYDSTNGEPKAYFDMTGSDIVESHKEYLRIENDHSTEKKYIRLCLDELTQYPSGYILTLKESEPFPDYSEKGLEGIPSFKDLCAKIKWIVKLEESVCLHPEKCELPFSSTGFEGFNCYLRAEICDGAEEPYVSFWLERPN